MRLADVNAGVVRNVIEVTDDQPRPDWCADWPEMGDTGGVGWLWDGTTFTAPAEAAPDLAGMRAEARARVNAAAGAIRARYITDAVGMPMVYMDKEAEARRWLEAGSPADLTGYPALSAEVGITAPDAAQLAALWLAMGSAWRAVSAQIEAARMAAMAGIASADDLTGISAAVEGFSAATATL